MTDKSDTHDLEDDYDVHVEVTEGDRIHVEYHHRERGECEFEGEIEKIQTVEHYWRDEPDYWIHVTTDTVDYRINQRKDVPGLQVRVKGFPRKNHTLGVVQDIDVVGEEEVENVDDRTLTSDSADDGEVRIPYKADVLYSAGYETAEDAKQASIDELAELRGMDEVLAARAQLSCLRTGDRVVGVGADEHRVIPRIEYENGRSIGYVRDDGTKVTCATVRAHDLTDDDVEVIPHSTITDDEETVNEEGTGSGDEQVAATPTETPDTVVDTGEEDDLEERAREYAREVVEGSEWELDDVNLEPVEFEVSSRMKSTNGKAIYHQNDWTYTIRLSEHAYELAGWEFLKETIRHELVHVWQYQHMGENRKVDGEWIITVDDGHGEAFQSWVDLMDLDGRCSGYAADPFERYTYVLTCPECGSVDGYHRLCDTVWMYDWESCDCGHRLELARRTEEEIEVFNPDWSVFDGEEAEKEAIRRFARGDSDRWAEPLDN